jgi:hypothetical protein
MKVIVCIDDNGGMLFNKRRQSRDRKVMEDISLMTDKIWIHPFSEKLLTEGEMKFDYVVDEAFLEQAKEGEYCFVENMALLPVADRIEELVIYHWNRKYPADFKLDLPYKKWKKQSKEEFAGFSHEKITKEIYQL